MYCEKCGCKLEDNVKFCPKCGNEIKKHKNIYVALILTFFITGLGSVYAGKTRKGLALLIIRIVLSVLGLFISIFSVFATLIWAYAFYEAYKDVKIACGSENPRLIDDFKMWNSKHRIIAILIIFVILIFTVNGCIDALTVPDYSTTSSDIPDYLIDEEIDTVTPSRYGGVDTSPYRLAKSDPDSFYDYYEYGDFRDIDDYLESEGFD